MIIMIGVTAILLSHTYSVQAKEVVIFKCQKGNKIVYQDQVCTADAQQEHITYSYAEPTVKGLREHEKQILEQIAKRGSKGKQVDHKHTISVNK